MRLLTDEELRLVSGGYTPPRPSCSQCESDNTELQEGLAYAVWVLGQGPEFTAYGNSLAAQAQTEFLESCTGTYLSYTLSDINKLDLDQMAYNTINSGYEYASQLLALGEKAMHMDVDGLDAPAPTGTPGGTTDTPGSGGTGTPGTGGDAGGGSYC